MKAVHILDVIVECLSCGDEALAIDSDVTNEGLRCRFCGKEVIVKPDNGGNDGYHTSSNSKPPLGGMSDVPE